MSGEDLYADIEGLSGASQRFGAAADAVDKALRTVRSRVDSRSAADWGGDQPGGVFGDGYQQAHADAMATLEDIVSRLRDAAEAVSDSARQLLDREMQSAHGIGSNGTTWA